MGSEATRKALDDAGLEFGDIQEAYCGFAFGPSCSGQRALYELGMTGIPVFNVNNACASGSSALWLARRAIVSQQADCVLALGFDEMSPGALGGGETGHTNTVDHIWKRFAELGYAIRPHMGAPDMFGAAGEEYMKNYDAPPELFAEVAVKTRNHAENNPMALLTNPITVQQVMDQAIIREPYLTRFMACPPTCGAAAAVVCSPEFARRKGITAPVSIAGQAMTTDSRKTYDSAMDLVGREMGYRAAQAVYEEAGIGPSDVDVCELHDCFTPNEVVSYEALGLCQEGEAVRFVRDGDNTYGGQVVVNPSGGLMSKGHPLGATGLAQCTELVEQIRGVAGHRQVDNAKVALQHNIGLGGACVVTAYTPT